MKQLEASSRYHIIEAMIHIIGWGIVFAFPFIMMTRSGFTISWQDYLHHGGIVPVTFLIVFYVNYFILIPHYLFKGRTKEYFILNILLILRLEYISGKTIYRYGFQGRNMTRTSQWLPPAGYSSFGISSP